MPESKKRKKAVYVPPPAAAATRKKGPSPVWVPALMLGLMILGVAWLVVYYMGSTGTPLIGEFGNWNLLIGFGFIVAGFAMSTQWR
ncbi:MAG: crgA [Frankiales bacterium]|nr:crgA [Frankiales bacterium]